MPSRNEHKRVKHRHMSGDVSKAIKIAMREKKTPIEVSSWQTISSAAAKNYRNVLKEKGRAVQRRRDEKAVEEELDGN